MNILKPSQIGSLKLKNRVVMPPMCMYCAKSDGLVTDFHLAHYSTRVVGGVGLVIVEATAVAPEGRISAADLGLWSDDQVNGHKKLVQHCHELDGKIAIQLAHAGRKCEVEDIDHLAPSAIDFNPEQYPCPNEMSTEEIHAVIEQFKAAAKRADQAGYDAIEIHAAHGYLIHEFLSPLSNHRTDEYGGSLQNRTRFLKEIVEGVHAVWPTEKPMWIRVSATDYLEGGLTVEDICHIVDALHDQIDLVHVSSGGLLPAPIPLYAGYQVHYAEMVRKTCNIPVIAVGLLNEFDLAQNVIQDGRADFVAIGRELLRNPYWVLYANQKRKVEQGIPKSYIRGF